MFYAQVAVALPLPALTYAVPEGLDITDGDPVRVRVRKKEMDGIVLGVSAAPPADAARFEIKALEGKSEAYPRLQPESLRFLLWAADYYHRPIGEVLRGFLPPDPSPKKREIFRLSPGAELRAEESLKGKTQRALVSRLRRGPGVVRGEERPAAKKLVELGWIERLLVDDVEMPVAEPREPCPFPLTDHQASAMEILQRAQDSGEFRAFLLQGVTGSGKTEVYLRSAAHALAAGRNVLVVVPEIALTPQLVARFRRRLGEPIAVLHSGISDGERSRQWHQLNRGLYRICIGARSAALAPIQSPGLIIVDEEHDSALKQEDHLRYNARDLCLVRAKMSQATVILGSATPSLESYHNAHSGRYQHILLPDRASGRSMPEVMVVDRTKDSAEGSLSNPLRLAIRETLAASGQVMLLLNRRGFSSFLLCGGCGHVPECPNCSVSLTNYQSSRLLKCHYCGHSEATPPTCPKCGHAEVLPGTLGTESLEEEVRGLFPGRSVLRIDRESVERKGALEEALGAIASGSAEIVIGTQIIAKGHDFPNIALVGVVNADSSFHLPDFRASEKSFQLFTQMAGRAGRGERPGKVILQTYNPRHPSIVHATSHDYRSYAEEELVVRRAFEYPPFTRMARLLISAPSSHLAEEFAEQTIRRLRPMAERLQVEIIGPAPAVLAKVQNKYRWNVLLKCRQAGSLHALIQGLRRDAPAHADRRILLQVDVDPVSLM